MRVPSAVRRVTDPLIRHLRVPVLSGVNRGRRWGLLSAGAGYVSGRRQAGQLELIQELLEPGDTVWDVGAHHGYVTLCAAAHAGSTGHVHAFEPSAENRDILERHMRWNDVQNVTVHAYALSDADGTASFGGAHSSKTRALGAGTEHVVVRRGETLVRDHGCAAPTFVKLDVEGAEGAAVEGLASVLPAGARLMIAMHSAAADARCVEVLSAAGFELIASAPLRQNRRRPWVSDPDLFAIGPACASRDRVHDTLRRAGFTTDWGAQR